MSPGGPGRDLDSALSLLGLARRAGALAVGTAATRDALRKGAARAVLLADDASDVQKQKVVGVMRHRDVPRHGVPSGAALGAALGEGPLTAVAVTDAGLARRLDRLLSGGEDGGTVQRR